MTRVRMLCVSWCVAATLVVATSQPAFAKVPAQDATSLAVEADAAHDAGRIGEAAELYARAYRAMTPAEKSALGEVIVAAALDDMHASFDATSDVAYQLTAGALLDEYERDAGGLPESLAQHREWILPAVVDEEPAPIERESDAPAPRRRRVAAADMAARTTTTDAPARRRDVVAAVSIGIGIAAAIGGIAAIGVGAPLGRRAARARSNAFADPRFLALRPDDPATIDYVDGYDAYVHHERQRTKALVAVGSVLLVAGLGVAIYGVARLVRHRRASQENARFRPIHGGFAF